MRLGIWMVDGASPTEIINSDASDGLGIWMVDGASPTEIIGIPTLLTGWAAAFALIDRWVIKRDH
jgi:hypothetical protein